MIKKLKWVVVGLLALIIVVISVVVMRIDGIVRSTVETQATASTKLQTTLGGASVSIFGGKVKLTDLSVASPEGFTAPRMIQLGEIGLEAGLSGLRQDPVRVGAITIRKPVLTLEQKDFTLNLKAAMAGMPPSNSDPVKLVIGTITVEDATVILRPGLPGLANEIVVPIGSVTVNNVGTGEGAENGTAIKDVLMGVATAMAKKAADSDKIPPELRALLNTDLAGLKAQFQEELGKKTEQLKGQLQGATSRASEEAKKALDKGLGDLLGGKKK